MREQKRIKKQVRKLQKLKLQLISEQANRGDSSDTQRLLEIILDELNQNKVRTSFS